MAAKNLLILAALFVSACSSTSPTAPSPTPTPTPTPPAQATLTGHVSATNGGQALGGLSVDIGGQTVQTDASGTFRSTATPTASMRAILSGAGIVPRTVYLAAGVSREVAVDAIAPGAFDMTFYRAFVRNATQGQLQPLRRLARAPLVYVRTVDDAGAAIDPTTIRTTIDAVWSVGTSWTGGAFGIVDVPSGTEDHTGQAGWLTVTWLHTPDPAYCGLSDVGRDGGAIVLSRNPSCACGASAMQPSTVRHELGHAFGFYHTGDAGDLMSGLGSRCDQQPSARELYHAAIAYKRPVGNADPDVDPASAVNLAPMRAY